MIRKMNLASELHSAFKLALFQVFALYINLWALTNHSYYVGGYNWISLVGCIFSGIFGITMLLWIRYKNLMYTWNALKND